MGPHKKVVQAMDNQKFKNFYFLIHIYFLCLSRNKRVKIEKFKLKSTKNLKHANEINEILTLQSVVVVLEIQEIATGILNPLLGSDYPLHKVP